MGSGNQSVTPSTRPAAAAQHVHRPNIVTVNAVEVSTLPSATGSRSQAPPPPRNWKSSRSKKCTCPDEDEAHWHCNICGLTFGNPEQTARHMFVKHNHVPEGCTIYSCPLPTCRKAHFQRFQLKKHAKDHLFRETDPTNMQLLQTCLNDLEAKRGERRRFNPEKTTRLGPPPGGDASDDDDMEAQPRHRANQGLVSAYRRPGKSSAQLEWYKNVKKKRLSLPKKPLMRGPVQGRKYASIRPSQTAASSVFDQDIPQKSGPFQNCPTAREYAFQSEDGRTAYKCGHCGSVLRSSWGFQSHVFRMHKAVLGCSRYYWCEDCDYRTVNRREIVVHGAKGHRIAEGRGGGQYTRPGEAPLNPAPGGVRTVAPPLPVSNLPPPTCAGPVAAAAPPTPDLSQQRPATSAQLPFLTGDEEKAAIMSFLRKYRADDGKYHCHSCQYSSRQQAHFREHLILNHQIFDSRLRHYVCDVCAFCEIPFGTIKQHSYEDHLRGGRHIDAEQRAAELRRSQSQAEADVQITSSYLPKRPDATTAAVGGAQIKMEREASASSQSGQTPPVLDDAASTSSAGSRSGARRNELLAAVHQHRVGKDFSCPHCHKDVSQLDNFVNHVFSQHGKKFPNCTYYECNDCDPPFRTSLKEKFNLHEECDRHKMAMKAKARAARRDSGSAEPPSKRPRVSVESGGVSSVSYVSENVFECNMCKMRFGSVNDVGNHLDACHGNLLESIRFNCHPCFESRDSLGSFREHLKCDAHKETVRQQTRIVKAEVKTEPEAMQPQRKRRPSRGPDSDAECVEISSDSDDVVSDDDGAAESDDDTPTSLLKVTSGGLHCERCDFLTTDLDTMMVEHNQQRHSRELFALSCGICDYKSSSIKEIMFHLTSRKHDRYMKNKFCDFKPVVTSIAYNLDAKDRIICVFCWKKIRLDKLENHMRDRHSNAKSRQAHCAACSEVVARLSDVESHLRTRRHLKRVAAAAAAVPSDAAPSQAKRSRLDDSALDASCTSGSASTVASPGSLTFKPRAVSTPRTSPSQRGPSRSEAGSSPLIPHDPPQKRVSLGDGEPPAFKRKPTTTKDELSSDEIWGELRRRNVKTCGCGISYVNTVSFTLHAQEHAAGNLLRCRHCDETFSDQLEFVSHSFETHHSADEA